MVDVISPHNAVPGGAGNATAVLLGIDASSTAIGWVVYDGAVIDYGEIRLDHADINHRCRLARAGVGLVVLTWPRIDAVAIESPVARYAKAVIPQAMVSGAIRSVVTERGLLICEVTPSQAKRALAQYGNASKALMTALAQKVYGVTGEHAADALGVALAAGRLISVERQTV